MARIRARTLIMYTDPAHGWMRVPFGDLELLGIEDKISSYSYVAPSQLPPAKAGGLPTEWASGLVDDSPLPRRTVKRLRMLRAALMSA